MIGDLTSDARELAESMSEISEEAYCAGWMGDLEYELWRIVLQQGGHYGDVEISQQQVARLRQLSALCGGWIIFGDENEETWLSHEQWKEIYESYQPLTRR